MNFDDIEEGQRDEMQAYIRVLLPRKNLIRRAAYQRVQVLGANIDRVVVITSYHKPGFSSGFIDRVLVEVEKNPGIDAAIVVNKSDLYSEKTDQENRNKLQLYRDLGYQVFEESFISGVSKPLETCMGTGVTLFIGHSGVGKSTLLNSLAGKEIQQIGEILKKGRHTTTNPFLYTKDNSTHFIDNPGVREFGLQHLLPENISSGFREFQPISCRFENCLHVEDPDCGVIKAVEQRKIADFRYQSYLSILESLSEKYKTRKGNYWSRG